MATWCVGFHIYFVAVAKRPEQHGVIQDRGNLGVCAWYYGVDDSQLYVSVIVLGEIRPGAELLRRHDRVAAAALDSWPMSLSPLYELQYL